MLLVNNMKTRKWAFLGTVLVIFLFLATFTVIILSSDKIHRGIFIEDVDLSGKDIDKAKSEVLDSINRTYKDENIILKCENKSWSFSLSDISYKFKLDEAINRAQLIGRTGNIFERLKEVIHTNKNKQNIKLDVEFEKKQLANILENIKKEVYKEGENASVLYNNGKITINKEKKGRYLDIDINMKLVENNIINKNFDSIELYVNEKNPDIIYEDINKIEKELASFSTVFNPGQANRSYNIKLACERINGMIIPPDGIFSMDKALGARTLENGYKEAQVIFKNELVPGTGGGVCQVTTTLYVSVLLAKLGVVEREHHSMPLGYVRPGQDATIAEGSIDFKFKNTDGYPICIFAETKGNKLNIKILGKKRPDDYKVKLVSEVLEEYLPEDEEIIFDNSLASDEKVVVREARKGLKVVVYRDTYNKDNKLIEREEISRDIYNPVRGQTKISEAYYNMLYEFEGIQDETQEDFQSDVQDDLQYDLQEDLQNEIIEGSIELYDLPDNSFD